MGKIVQRTNVNMKLRLVRMTASNRIGMLILVSLWKLAYSSIFGESKLYSHWRLGTVIVKLFLLASYVGVILLSQQKSRTCYNYIIRANDPQNKTPAIKTNSWSKRSSSQSSQAVANLPAPPIESKEVPLSLARVSIMQCLS